MREVFSGIEMIAAILVGNKCSYGMTGTISSGVATYILYLIILPARSRGSTCNRVRLSYCSSSIHGSLCHCRPRNSSQILYAAWRAHTNVLASNKISAVAANRRIPSGELLKSVSGSIGNFITSITAFDIVRGALRRDTKILGWC